MYQLLCTYLLALSEPPNPALLRPNVEVCRNDPATAPCDKMPRPRTSLLDRGIARILHSQGGSWLGRARRPASLIRARTVSVSPRRRPSSRTTPNMSAQLDSIKTLPSKKKNTRLLRFRAECTLFAEWQCYAVAPNGPSARKHVMDNALNS